jgi:hypothetical protein
MIKERQEVMNAAYEKYPNWINKPLLKSGDRYPKLLLDVSHFIDKFRMSLRRPCL